MWNLRSFRLEIVLVSEQDSCMVWAKCTICSEIVLDAPNGDVAQVEGRLGSFGDSANLEARWVHGLRRMYHRLRNHFRHTRWNSSVMWVVWNLDSVYLKTVLVLVQDRCTVCVNRMIGSEIIFDTPNGTSGDEDQVEAHWVCLKIVFILTQDRCMVCAERTISSKIILDAPDGTPRWRGSCGILFRSIWR
jgi:hypothetical protein